VHPHKDATTDSNRMVTAFFILASPFCELGLQLLTPTLPSSARPVPLSRIRLWFIRKEACVRRSDVGECKYEREARSSYQIETSYERVSR
jgi:hypothetical protein